MRILLSLLLLSSFYSFSQEKKGFREVLHDVHFGMQFQYLTTVSSMNSFLESEDIDPINPLASGLTGGVRFGLGNHYFGIGGRFVFPSNYVERDSFGINITSINGGIFYQYDLLGKSDKWRLQPGIEIGTNSVQLIAQANQDSLSLMDFANGEETMFFERSGFSFYVMPTVSFDFSLVENRSVDLFFNAGYKYNFWDYSWSIPNMPLSRLDGVMISAGVRFNTSKTFVK